MHPDRLEVVNPGPLPLGVTPQNILHTTVRRNEHLARLLHDLKLMEREGSGFDKVFEVLLSQGRPAPELVESHDRVQVTIRRRILRPEVIDFILKADQTYQLTQRERITLGLLAQHDALTSRELMTMLELPSVDALQPWLSVCWIGASCKVLGARRPCATSLIQLYCEALTSLAKLRSNGLSHTAWPRWYSKICGVIPGRPSAISGCGSVGRYTPSR